MKTPLYFLLIIFFQLPFQSTAQQFIDQDSIIYFPNNPFFKDYQKNGKGLSIANPLIGIGKIIASTKKPFRHHFVNTGENLYMTVSKTGMVYKMTESESTRMTFKRIDNTENINYNIGAMVFPYEGDIYSFSGYGFWKSNGLLRRYNYKSQEWDIMQLNKEIIPQVFPSLSTWYDIEQEKLYVFFQRIMNAGLKDADYIEGKKINESYVLNLKTQDWQYLGNTNPKLVSLISNCAYSISSDKGIFLMAPDGIYWIDVKNNEGFKIDSIVLFQEVARVIKSNFCYMRDTTLYYSNLEFANYDSLKFNLNSKVGVFPLVFQSDNVGVNTLYVAGSIIFITGIILLIFWRRKKKDVKTEIKFEKESQLELSTLEKNLIQLLISKNGNSATIQEVNYVLGLKNKNIGLQKKVRSDVINSINEIYYKTSGNKALLIQSIRSDSDKRIFEYVIDMNRANEILGKSNDEI